MPKKKLPDSVSIREIEDAAPCRGEYSAFLYDMKSNAYSDYFDVLEIFRKSRFGPDDRIPISTILNTLSSGDKSGTERVQWLISNVESLCPVLEAYEERMEQRATKVLAEMFPKAKAKAKKKVK